MTGIRLGKFSGIELNLHISFVLWLGVVLVLLPAIVPFIIGIFAIITLHEFGHCMTAKYFNWKVKTITLTPIGGLAHIEEVNNTPRQDFWVAVAGPLVNIFLIPILAFLHEGLYFINLMILGFNMLPFYPMDGGRILGSIIESFTKNRILSKKIVIIIGQLGFISFIFFGVFNGYYNLVIVGMFLLIFTSAEMAILCDKNFQKTLQDQ